MPAFFRIFFVIFSCALFDWRLCQVTNRIKSARARFCFSCVGSGLTQRQSFRVHDDELRPLCPPLCFLKLDISCGLFPHLHGSFHTQIQSQRGSIRSLIRTSLSLTAHYSRAINHFLHSHSSLVRVQPYLVAFWAISKRSGTRYRQPHSYLESMYKGSCFSPPCPYP